jgi:hypothetical protein
LILTNPALLDASKLFDVDFVDDDVRAIFGHVREMRRVGEPIDTLHLAARLKTAGVYDDIGGAEFIASLLNHADVGPSRFPEYVGHLKELRRRRGALGAALATIKGVYSAQPTDDLLSDAAAQFEILATDGDSSGFEFTAMTMAELAAGNDEIVFDVAGILARHQPALLGGPPKSLKTSIGGDLGFSLATATPFLGTYAVHEKRRVLFMSGESGEAASRVCLRSIAESRGFNLSDVEDLLWCPDVPQFGSTAHEAALRRLLAKHRPDVVLLDPAYRVVGGVEHSNIFEMGAALAGINDMCRDVDATLVLLHHTKRNPARPNITTLDDLAYAGFREFFRQWILIARQSDYVPGSGLHELRIDVGGSARHSLAAAVTIDEGPFEQPRWYVTTQGVAATHEAQEQAKERRKADAQADKRRRDREKLVTAAAKFPEGETRSQLWTHASLNTSAGRIALGDALQTGELEPCQITKNGRTEDGYKRRSDTV